MILDLASAHMTPLGLFLDLVGFALVYMFRKDFWITTSFEPPTEEQMASMRSGDTFLQLSKTPYQDTAERQPKNWFHQLRETLNFWHTVTNSPKGRFLGPLGAAMVALGFVCQIIGSLI